MRSRLLLVFALVALGSLAFVLLRARGATAIALQPAQHVAHEPGPAPEHARLAEESAGREAQAERSGLASRAAANENAPTSPVERTAEQTVELRGVLVDEQGRRLTDGKPFASALREGEPRARIPQVLAENVLRWPRLTPGRWTVRASLAGREEVVRTLELVAGEQPALLELVLPRLPQVRLRVLDADGRPTVFRDGLLRPSAMATRDEPEERLPHGVEREDRSACGRYRGAELAGLDQDAFGLIELACEPPLWVSLVLGEHVLASQVLLPGVEQLDFTLDEATLLARTASLSLAVVDARSRERLPEARVELRAWNGLARSQSGAGRDLVRFGGLAPGSYRLEVGCAGHALVERELELAPGEERELGELALEPVGEARLHVTLDLPEQVREAWVLAVSASSLRERPVRNVLQGEPLRDGRREIELDLAGGSYALWCTAEVDGRMCSSARTLVELSSGTHEERLTLREPARVALQPAYDARRVWVRDEHGFFVLGGLTVEGDAPRTIELPAGRYEIVSRDPQGSERSVPLALGPEHASVALP